MPEPATYQTRPTHVEAYHYDGSHAEMYLVIGWILKRGGTAYPQSGSARDGTVDALKLEVPEGLVTVEPDEWVVHDSNNVWRNLKNEHFKALYDVPDQVS